MPCRRSYAGITCLGNAIITFKNENAVTGGSNSPAIQVAKHVGEGEGFTLTIQGDGSLTATGGSGAAGIGSGENGSCGNITINGGQVTAKGNYGIRADAGDIILGWKNPGDFIYASSYKAGSSKNVKIADGQSFTYVNTNDLLSGTLSADLVTAIAGKTLTPVSDKITVPAYRWATYYSDQPLTLGTNQSGAELYTISSVTDTEAVLSNKIEVAPKGTPLLVYNGSDKDKVIMLIPSLEPDLSLTVAKEFKGTTTAKAFDEAYMSDKQCYVLAGGKMFARVEGAGTIAAHRCWLELDNAKSARSLVIIGNDDQPTGIDRIDNSQLTIDNYSGAWYTLDGRKLDKMPTKKGVYIHGGKKEVVR
jgi:hypothetical protein